MFDKINASHLRLAAYVAAAVFGIWQVVTGAVEAEGLAQLVSDVDAQLGIVLAVVGGLAGRYVDRTGDPEPIITVDAVEVAEALAPGIVDAVRDHADARGVASDVLADMRARIDAARGGEPAPGRHRAEG